MLGIITEEVSLGLGPDFPKGLVNIMEVDFPVGERDWNSTAAFYVAMTSMILQFD